GIDLGVLAGLGLLNRNGRVYVRVDFLGRHLNQFRRTPLLALLFGFVCKDFASFGVFVVKHHCPFHLSSLNLSIMCPFPSSILYVPPLSTTNVTADRWVSVVPPEVLPA